MWGVDARLENRTQRLREMDAVLASAKPASAQQAKARNEKQQRRGLWNQYVSQCPSDREIGISVGDSRIEITQRIAVQDDLDGSGGIVGCNEIRAIKSAAAQVIEDG